jgi:TolB-like protein/cytochrome c-type biogenesis protein CcmH/NrfG
MRAIWPDTSVEENNLNQNISTLRRVLGETRGENRYIATTPGKGYRFIAEVEGGGALPVPVQAAPERVTLAVLPFENLSSDPEREYLADGLTEETIAALGQINPEHLGAIGRTSVMIYKKTTKTLGEIGSELGASYLVESTLRGEGGRFRVTSKLIRVKDQVQVWTASYDGEPASVLNFQRELSAAIAEQIRLRLSPERLNALARRQTRNAEAYDLYLRGLHYWHQLTPPTTRRAVECFSHATQLDPEYALAWSGLADANAASPINGDAPPLVMWPLAREAAARSVAAEPNLAEAQTSLGFVKFWFDWDWSMAEAAFRKAIELDPNYPMAHRMLGIALAHMGRYAEARPEMARLRELDPLLAVNHALSAQVAFAGREYAAALQFARQAIVVDPEFWIGLLQLGQAYEQSGQSELALEALNKAGRFSGGNSKAISLRGYLFAKLGGRTKHEKC